MASKLDSMFGWVDVDGTRYNHDIIIHSDGTVSKRKKKKSKSLKPKYGHTPLSKAELGFLSKEKFDALYIGTGHDPSLPITPKACKILKDYNAVILSTPEVIKKINQENNHYVAIIHSTC